MNRPVNQYQQLQTVFSFHGSRMHLAYRQILLNGLSISFPVVLIDYDARFETATAG